MRTLKTLFMHLWFPPPPSASGRGRPPFVTNQHLARDLGMIDGRETPASVNWTGGDPG